MIDIKDLQERALDYQYGTDIWGKDEISEAVHTLMMDHASGPLDNIKKYYSEDVKNLNYVFTTIREFVSDVKQFGINEVADSSDWKLITKISRYIKGLEFRELQVRNGKNLVDNEKFILRIMNTILKREDEYKTKLDYIYDNRKYLTIEYVFEHFRV